MHRKPLKIVIADDNRFFCDALKDSLNIHATLNVVQTFTTLETLIAFTNSALLDILVLDVNFNGINSLDFISEIRKTNKTFKIIVLTTMNNNFIKEKALHTGIDLFLGKDGDLANFKDIILACSKKELVPLEKHLSKITIDNYTFTKRKLEILQALYIHSDKNEKELSKLLHITESSLKSHKRDLFEITLAKSTPALIKFGIQKGLIIV